MKRIFLAASIIFISINLLAQTPNPKRGISVGNPHLSLADLQTMSGHLSWYYNWGINPESELEGILDDYQVEYIPMAWNGNFNETNLRNYYTAHPEAKYLLGFNEPNFIEQANMTPTQAAAQWPRLEAIADEFGLEIIGPAVNYCGTCVSENGTTYTNPFDYLDDFFAACPDCRVDYIAVHNYMCYSGPLIDYLEDFKKYNKKIWLTEFACGDQATITLDMQKSLMFGALDYLDNDTMIYRYSWFLARTGSGSWNIDIFDTEPGKLTELGEIYLYYNAIHDTSQYTVIPARIEAESYSEMSGIALQATSDFDGIANVGWIDADDYLLYNIDVPEVGDYYLYLRLSANAAANIEVIVDDSSYTFLDIPYTGGWQSWKTFNTVLPLEPGKSKLKLLTSTGNFNINWIKISDRSNSAPTVSAGEDVYLDLPLDTAALSADVNDEDKDELICQWTQTSGPACVINSPDSAVTAIKLSSAGNYTFKIAVWDGFELATDIVVVHLSEETAVLIDNERDFTVYPNPIYGKMNIVLPAWVQNGSLEISNISGQLMHKRTLIQSESEIELDLSSALPGIYFLKLMGTEQLGVLRIVKE